MHCVIYCLEFFILEKVIKIHSLLVGCSETLSNVLLAPQHCLSKPKLISAERPWHHPNGEKHCFHQVGSAKMRHLDDRWKWFHNACKSYRTCFKHVWGVWKQFKSQNKHLETTSTNGAKLFDVHIRYFGKLPRRCLGPSVPYGLGLQKF